MSLNIKWIKMILLLFLPVSFSLLFANLSWSWRRWINLVLYLFLKSFHCCGFLFLHSWLPMLLTLTALLVLFMMMITNVLIVIKAIFDIPYGLVLDIELLTFTFFKLFLILLINLFIFQSQFVLSLYLMFVILLNSFFILFFMFQDRANWAMNVLDVIIGQIFSFSFGFLLN